MGKHHRTEKPKKPNTLLDLAASAVPNGVEVAVIVRLEDSSFKLSRIYSLEEFQFAVEGLDLCAKTAAYQAKSMPGREKPPQSTPLPPPPASPDQPPGPPAAPSPPK
jgi:hypothetical protein